MKIIRAVATVGGYTGLSRVFGLVREILISNVMGVSAMTDAFFVAFKFPNFFRRFFAEGAFNASFVPIFAQKLTTDGRDEARKTAESVFAVLMAVLIVLVTLVIIFVPWIIHVLAPGFSTTPERLEMAITFIRITFPYILFISLAAFFAGILNSFDRFAAAAAAPIILNIVMIGAMFYYPEFGISPGHALAWAVFIAGVLQLAWLYGACRWFGFSVKLRRPRLTPEVRKLMKLMVPGAIGAGVMNINLLIDMSLASYLAEGSISYLHYADRLNQLPLSMFGIAIGTALLPSLSRQLRLGEMEKAFQSQSVSVELSLQLTFPATVGLALLAHPIINLIYSRLNEFDAAQTANALCAFSLGIPAYVLIKVFSTSYFARQDVKTPVKIALFCIGCNLIFNLVFMQFFAHVGMALATSLAAWINAILLFIMLKRREWFFLTSQVKLVAVKLSGACSAMALGLWMLKEQLTILLEDDVIGPFSHLSALIISGIVLFVILGQVTGAVNFTTLRGALRKSS